MQFSAAVRYAALRRYPQLRGHGAGEALDVAVDDFIYCLPDDEYDSLLESVEDPNYDDTARDYTFLGFVFGVLAGVLLWIE